MLGFALLLTLTSLSRGQADAFPPPSPRPLIAVSMNVPDDPGTTIVTLSLRSTYVDAVEKAGGLPILIPPLANTELAQHYAGIVDGFIFVGGPDINPSRFGQTPHETMKPIHPRREEFDFALMTWALETTKPILGICLGMQMLHVAHGGSMIQDIPSLTTTTINHRPSQPGSFFAHDVEILPDTRLHAIVSTTTLAVNSIHHQACVAVPKAPLRIGAKAPDGIVEAIELPGERFVIGVQWHPEFLTQHPEHLALFQELIHAARPPLPQAR